MEAIAEEENPGLFPAVPLGDLLCCVKLSRPNSSPLPSRMVTTYQEGRPCTFLINKHFQRQLRIVVEESSGLKTILWKQTSETMRNFIVPTPLSIPM